MHVIRINFFSTMELTKGVQRSREYFSRKRLNLDKSSDFCDILTCPILILTSHIHGSLEKQRTTIIAKTSSLTVTGGCRIGLELQRYMCIPSELSLLDQFCSSREDPTCKSVLTKSLPSAKSLTEITFQKQVETTV